MGLIFSLVWNSQVNTSPSTASKVATASPTKIDSAKETLPAYQTAAKKTLASMSEEDKLAQLLFVGVEGTTLSETERNMIESGHVGGVVLLGRNVKNANQLNLLVSSIKEANQSPVPLFIGIDEEGGRVSRIPSSLSNLPSSERIGELNDKEISEQVGSVLARKVKHFGINMNFAPVLDINNNPANEVIGDRSFGQTPAKVGNLGVATMQGIESEGIVPVIKHFPGHGDTSVDSHYKLPVIDKTVQQLESFEWKPFKQAIAAGADVIMTAHILFPALDDQYPATFSEKIIQGVLREQLNYDGLVITDDMAMGAIANDYGTTEAAVRSVQAGADMVMLTDTRNGNFQNVHTALKQAVEQETVSLEQVNESVERILQTKQKYELNSPQEQVKEDELNEDISQIWEQIQ
ncbi:beta-N-acetylhexosaminidase [Halobacillus locisalis]|uniref:Beta-N-acetylhexosaminidase n=2 Tax=Halobacillus locisalis TaxID=220753 RepID=A0A838CSY7_9BACI|nr:beta-N-acetylhexosaminidase [Halobacillus locisalis]